MRALSLQSAGSLEFHPCSRCGGTKSTVALASPDRQFPVPGVFYASRCDVCGLLFQNPRIPLERLPDHYPKDYSAYSVWDYTPRLEPLLWHLKHRHGYRHIECELRPSKRQMRLGRWAANRLLVPDFVRGGRLVEIGCAAGNTLAMLKGLGWEHCTGYEYSDTAATKARERGLEVVAGPFEATVSAIPDRSLDVVVAGYVMEHVPNPFQLTRQIAAKLKPGGKFVFSTINVGTPDFWLYGPYWYDLDLPRHMVFFRKEDVRAMLCDEFRIEAMVSDADTNDYLVSAKYRRRDAIGGWRKLVDSAVLRMGNRLARPTRWLARAGLGSRILVTACKL